MQDNGASSQPHLSPAQEADQLPTDGSSGSVSRKRSLRACDGCRHRRMKCEDLQQSPHSGHQSCKVCRENREACTFNAPVRKRGPRPGWRLRAQSSPENPKSELRDPSRDMRDHRDIRDAPYGSHSSHPHSHAHGSHATQHLGVTVQSLPMGAVPVSSTRGPPLSPLATTNTLSLDSRDEGSTSPGPQQMSQPPASKRARVPLMGLPTALVDQLLAVYFTHVHNVWPLIYKPMFHPHTTSQPLLLAMLAIAACVAPPPDAQEQSGIDKDKLFQMAESALHRCRMECRVDIIQSLILLSLRQTGCGDKHSAFTYAGRACCMALNLGLNLAPAQYESSADSELRARVYWNCYVLDKTLAEETGRSFILPYRRSSTPLPSINEVDEYETWPPLPTSALPLPRSVRHIVPRRGYVMSCFVWTCHLAMVVENILDLDVVGPPVPQDSNPWVQQFTMSLMEDRGEAIARAERISAQLEGWRNALPQHLDVDMSPNVSPLPHHIVGLAWYHSAQILLHSRFIKRRGLFPGGDKAEEELAARTHVTCSKAAESVIELLAHLDRHRLLSQTSSDVIHILSLATLFEAFDASDPNEQLAERAKVNFAQCCIWLRDCSKSWPTASAHKLFFEGLIQGGLKLSNAEDTLLGLSPPSAAFAGSPPMPDGLRAIGRNLADDMPRTCLPPLGISNLFQLPQFYWNHLTNAIPGGPGQPPNPQNLDASTFEFMLGSPEASMGMALPDWSSPAGTDTRAPLGGTNRAGPNAGAAGTGAGAGTATGGKVVPSMPPSDQPSQSPSISWDPSLEHSAAGATPGSTASGAGGANTFVPVPQALDQSAVYSALMSFMVEAARSQ